MLTVENPGVFGRVDQIIDRTIISMDHFLILALAIPQKIVLRPFPSARAPVEIFSGFGGLDIMPRGVVADPLEFAFAGNRMMQRSDKHFGSRLDFKQGCAALLFMDTFGNPLLQQGILEHFAVGLISFIGGDPFERVVMDDDIWSILFRFSLLISIYFFGENFFGRFSDNPLRAAPPAWAAATAATQIVFRLGRDLFFIRFFLADRLVLSGLTVGIA